MLHITNNHSRDLACALNDMRECIAIRPEACICRQMPREVYQSRREEHNAPPKHQRTAV